MKTLFLLLVLIPITAHAAEPQRRRVAQRRETTTEDLDIRAFAWRYQTEIQIAIWGGGALVVLYCLYRLSQVKRETGPYKVYGIARRQNEEHQALLDRDWDRHQRGGR